MVRVYFSSASYSSTLLLMLADALQPLTQSNDTSAFKVFMIKQDGRKVSDDVREVTCVAAIQKWIDGGIVQNSSKEYDTDTSCICRWTYRYRRGGMEAL